MSEFVHHCYLVQTHHQPQQILRLVRTLRRGSPDSLIFVFHDGRHCTLDPGLLSCVPGCEVLLSPYAVRRGEFSLVEAYLDGAEHIHRLGVGYQWLTLLSGQDYPIKPLADYERHLDESDVQGFLTYGDVLGPDSPWPNHRRGHRRYFYRYSILDERWRPWLQRLRWMNNLTSLIHLHTTYGAHLGVRLLRPAFDRKFHCYAGSGWHSLRRECVDYLLELRAAEDPVVERFRHTVAPDEAFCQTLLVNSGRFRLCNDNLRCIEFTGSLTGSPRTFTSSDLDRLLASPSYFARKFDVTVDEAVLDALDERLCQESDRAAERIA